MFTVPYGPLRRLPGSNCDPAGFPPSGLKGTGSHLHFCGLHNPLFTTLEGGVRQDAYFHFSFLFALWEAVGNSEQSGVPTLPCHTSATLQETANRDTDSQQGAPGDETSGPKSLY